jgi:hypothetical protein
VDADLLAEGDTDASRGPLACSPPWLAPPVKPGQPASQSGQGGGIANGIAAAGRRLDVSVTERPGLRNACVASGIRTQAGGDGLGDGVVGGVRVTGKGLRAAVRRAGRV